jgi:hypothetical protein
MRSRISATWLTTPTTPNTSRRLAPSAWLRPLRDVCEIAQHHDIWVRRARALTTEESKSLPWLVDELGQLRTGLARPV